MSDHLVTNGTIINLFTICYPIGIQSNRLLHMDTPELVDQQNLTFVSCAQTLSVVKRTFQERWLIGAEGER